MTCLYKTKSVKQVYWSTLMLVSLVSVVSLAIRTVPLSAAGVNCSVCDAHFVNVSIYVDCQTVTLLLLLLLLFTGCLLLNKSRVVDVSNRLNLGEVLQPTPNAAIKEIAPRRAGDTTSRTTAIDCHIQARFAYSVLIGFVKINNDIYCFIKIHTH